MKNFRLEMKRFLQHSKKPLLMVLGPTASGKSALGIELAKKYDGEIISADSRQVYKEMTIGTDKIDQKAMKEIEHHLIDCVSPDEPFTLADFRVRAREIIRKIHRAKKIPVVVGGTGLYLSALSKNYRLQNVPPDEKLRESLLKDAEGKPDNYLYEKLKRLDERAAETIHPGNARYIIRALEINLKSGKRKKNAVGKPEYDVLQIGIGWPREVLYRRIEERVEMQIQRGLCDEVDGLLRKYDPALPSMTSLGYREIIMFFKNQISLPEAIALIKKNTKNYAKRQMTWFRRSGEIIWLDGSRLERGEYKVEENAYNKV